MNDKECCEESWMYGLKKEGLYYEGVVADLDNLLENYKRTTVTTWETWRSSTNMNGGENGDLSDCKCCKFCQTRYNCISEVPDTRYSVY